MFATRILALETSGQSGSVALLRGHEVVGQIQLDASRRNAQTLAPAMQDLLQSHGWRPADVQAVAVAIGPGSFTGLRVGVTTAKTFAYAVGAQVVGVNTLDAIAYPAADVVPKTVERLIVGMDALRGELFAASYRRAEEGRWTTLEPASVVPVAEWLRQLSADIAVTGPALAKLADQLPANVFVVSREHWYPQAVSVGSLAATRLESGEFDDLWKLAPLYLRRSAAEEKLDG